ncbi:MAG: riboflavin synthase [Saprospiraceae bacterium]|nr:riboflavin synthase [Saprospiraceae bacterium]
MFTGIIECLGRVRSVIQQGSNQKITISSPISSELKVDQSVAHDGVCLTVIESDADSHIVEAVEETLRRTTLGEWTPNRLINLERSMVLGDRLDGHMVQGHIDTTAYCRGITNASGSSIMIFEYDPQYRNLVVEKGSISVNGISLTVNNPTNNTFEVSIIPYTWQHTNLSGLSVNEQVNIEFDIIAKYLFRQAIQYQ